MGESAFLEKAAPESNKDRETVRHRKRAEELERETTSSKGRKEGGAKRDVLSNSVR